LAFGLLQHGQPLTFGLLCALNSPVHRITRSLRAWLGHWARLVLISIHVHFAPDAYHVPIEFKMTSLGDISRSPQLIEII
jgi:hypothetical protein